MLSLGMCSHAAFSHRRKAFSGSQGRTGDESSPRAEVTNPRCSTTKQSVLLRIHFSMNHPLINAVGPCSDSTPASQPQPNPAPSDITAIHFSNRIGPQIPIFTWPSMCGRVKAALPLVLLFSLPCQKAKKFHLKCQQEPLHVPCTALSMKLQEGHLKGGLMRV